MTMWDAATVAQFVGVDVVGIIATIRQAARTARQNIMNCQLLALQVDGLSELLPCMIRRLDPEAVRILAGLGGTLLEARDLVMSCQGMRCRVYKLCTASRMADRFKDVQNKIDVYLSFIPAISYVGITRRLDGRDHRRSSSHSRSQQVPAAYSDSSEDDDIDIRCRIMDARDEVDDLFDQNCKMMKRQSHRRFRKLTDDWAADKEERAAYSDSSEDDDIDSHMRDVRRRIMEARDEVDDLFDQNCTKMKRQSHRRFRKLYNEIKDDWAADKVPAAYSDSEDDGMCDVHWRIMEARDEVDDFFDRNCKKMERRAHRRFKKVYNEITDDRAADKKVKKAPRKK